jgi:hypothetical protein
VGRGLTPLSHAAGVRGHLQHRSPCIAIHLLSDAHRTHLRARPSPMRVLAIPASATPAHEMILLPLPRTQAPNPGCFRSSTASRSFQQPTGRLAASATSRRIGPRFTRACHRPSTMAAADFSRRTEQQVSGCGPVTRSRRRCKPDYGNPAGLLASQPAFFASMYSVHRSIVIYRYILYALSR